MVQSCGSVWDRRQVSRDVFGAPLSAQRCLNAGINCSCLLARSPSQDFSVESYWNHVFFLFPQFVEVAIGADVDPQDVIVHLYNGANGGVYRMLAVRDSALFQKGEVTSGRRAALKL